MEHTYIPMPLTIPEMRNKQLFQELYARRAPEELLQDAITRQDIESPFYEVFHDPWGPEQVLRMPRDITIIRQERYYPIGSHSHDGVEIICVVNGNCPHRVGDHFGELHTGDVLLISPGTSHSLLPISDDCILYNIYINLDLFEQNFQPLLQEHNLLSNFFIKTLYANSRNAYLVFHTGGYFHSKNYLSELTELWFHPVPHMRSRLNSLALLLLFDLLDFQAAPPTVCIDLITSKVSVQTLQRYIHSHIQTVTVKELCDVFNYSQRQITRIIFEATGQSCLEYIHFCRRETFLSLLVSSSIGVNRCMELSGIRSPSKFFTVFRKAYGMSPNEYRKMYQSPHLLAQMSAKMHQNH